MDLGQDASGSTSKPKPSGANLQLLLEHDMTARRTRRRQSIVSGTPQREYVSIDAYPPSAKSITELEAINAADLQPDIHHRGKVIFVRTADSGIRTTAVQTIVEDEQGQPVRLFLRNCDHSVPPEELLPEDALLAIKEPFYSAASNGAHGIRIDHPSDLVRLRNSDHSIPRSLQADSTELAKSAQDWKNDGNKAYGAQQFHAALHAYGQAIQLCTTTDERLRRDVLRNRAAVHIFLQQFDEALSDAKAAIIPLGEEGDQDAASLNGKAYERAGHAAYQLGRFSDAAESYQRVKELIAGHPGASSALQRIKTRLREQQNGDYDFTKMKKSCNKKNSRLDHASYFGNTEVRPTPTRGNGLFATRKFNVGDLIMVEKALSISYDTDAGSELYTIFNNKTERVVTGTQTTLMFKLIQLLLHSPGDAKRFFDLYDGEYEPKLEAELVDGVVPIDSFRVEAIVEYNSFACPSMKTTTTKSGSKDESAEALHSTGFWPRISYINHACDGNAMRAFIGDMMIIRATKDISDGDEILMPYRLPDAVNSVTQEKLQKTWGFKCDCSICLAEATVGQSQLKTRRQLVERLDRALATKTLSVHYNKNKKEIALVESLTERLQETYDDSEFGKQPRLALVGPRQWLCRAQNQGGPPDRIIEASLALLRELGFFVVVKGKSVIIDRQHGISERTSIDAARDTANSFKSKGSAEVSRQFVKMARVQHLICNADADSFREET